MRDKRYLDPTNDSLFKKIFSDTESLKEFLNAILDLPPMFRIKEIEYIPFQQLPIIHHGKSSSFDLKVKDESGNWYIIEMQKKSEADYLKRVQYYAAHSYTSQLKIGGQHADLLPIVVISLIKNTMFGEEIPCISFHKTMETTTKKQCLFDFSYVFIELGKFNKQTLSNIADEWLHMFKCAIEENEPPTYVKSKKVLEAYHAIEMHGLSVDEYDLYIRTKLFEDGQELAIEEGFNKGFNKGIEQGKVEIVKNMLFRSMDNQTISELTGLSAEEVENLKSFLQ